MKNLVVLLCTLGCCVSSFAQPRKKDKQISQDIAAFMSAEFRNDQPGCAVAVVKKGQVLYKDGFGLANIEWNMPIKSNTAFQIGSVTKLFTALATLQLAEKNKLSLSDPLQKYIPDFPHGSEITIEHLLTHSSGIKEYLNIPHPDPNAMRRDFSPTEVIDFFKNEPLDFKPGTKSAYTNSGYFLLGYIIEKVSGQSYSKYIEENIFKPAGMSHSYYGSNSIIVPNRADCYQLIDGKYHKGDYRSMSIPYSAGAIVSTVDDMIAWHQALIENKLLGKEWLTKAFNAYQLAGGGTGTFGYGWFINPFEIQGRPTRMHSGGLSAFNSFVLYLPEDDIFVVALSNYKEALVQELSINLATLALGHEVTAGFKVNPAIINSYKGKYAMPQKPDRVATISELEGHFIIEVVNEWRAELVAVSETSFVVKNIKPAATLEFIKDSNGKVNRFVISQNGMYEWLRKE